MADRSSSSFTYDVFLSFRGSDTRHGFTGFLWKALCDRGIHTFIDDGNEITPSLVKVIEESRVSIIVFSENYAASSFCLDVLAYILDNLQFQRNHRFVFPVFYDVDPSDVRHQRGTYGEALVMHDKKFKANNTKVQKWRNALNEAANLYGWHFKPGGDGYEFEFIGRIVEEVSSKINRAPLHVADYPVGLESPLREVCSLLEVGSDDRVLMVGIYGIGGIGKTTLAREVFNLIAHQFEGLCFLDHVRENSNKHGLMHLQNMLLSEIIGEKYIQLGNAKKGVSVIKHRLHQKKVLLILDDVDRLEQLEALVGGPDWFGSGSRIIITTRDKHLLAFHGVERVYKVEELNDRDALELLSRKAFRRGNIDPSYKEILRQVVTYASGLPLALKVIGSNLSGRSVNEWRHALDQYKLIPYHEIQKILKASFDALSEGEQNVFLDIACSFKGYQLEDVEDILHAHYGYDMKHYIRVLVEKSLISISSDGNVTLHPLIEDMGKEIVRRESPEEPGKRSRLWFPKDIVQVLEENTGTSRIKIIHLDFPLTDEKEAEVKWDGEAFKKMENLRTLIIKKCHFSKAPLHLPNSLRVLEWLTYPSEELPSDFHPKKLAMLKIPNIRFMSPELADLLKRVSEILPTSQSVPEVLQTSQRFLQVTMQTSQRLFPAKMMWRLVGFVSSVVGLFCYALSPSFNRLIGGWNIFKFFLYMVLSLVVCATILFAKQSSLSTQHVQLQMCMSSAVLIIISVYSFFYDKAVSGRPETLSLVSNAAFALVSLSLSRLIQFRFDMGIFSYFVGCLTIQLVTINWKLILVAIIFGCPLLIMHSFSDCQLKAGGQVIHSYSDSQPGDEGHVIHSSLNSQLEVGSYGQHVIDIHT